ncbi:hypothetical protein SDJN03_09370, partial [Cucurbita argyrosperma subsp. sororia]
MAITIADDDKRLETGSLSSTGLLLDRRDLHYLVLEARANECINDLVLLNRERVVVYLLQGLDFSLFYEATKLGDRNPLLLFVASNSTTATAAASAAEPSSKSTALRHNRSKEEETVEEI